MLVIPGQGRFPTLRLDDIESCVEKLSNDQFADKPFVFDNEDLHGSTPFHLGVFRVAFLMTLALSGHGFTGPVIWYPLGLTSANRLATWSTRQALGTVNVALQECLANVARGENDLDIGTTVPHQLCEFGTFMQGIRSSVFLQRVPG